MRKPEGKRIVQTYEQKGVYRKISIKNSVFVYKQGLFGSEWNKMAGHREHDKGPSSSKKHMKFIDLLRDC